MHIKDAAMEKAPAAEPPNTFRPTVKISMYVPMNSLTSFECRGYPSSGPGAPNFSLQPGSSGRHTQKRTVAKIAPMNSKTVYIKQCLKPPMAVLATSIPHATAGLKHPPETPPAPYA